MSYSALIKDCIQALGRLKDLKSLKFFWITKHSGNKFEKNASKKSFF